MLAVPTGVALLRGGRDCRHRRQHRNGTLLVTGGCAAALLLRSEIFRRPAVLRPVTSTALLLRAPISPCSPVIPAFAGRHGCASEPQVTVAVVRASVHPLRRQHRPRAQSGRPTGPRRALIGLIRRHRQFRQRWPTCRIRQLRPLGEIGSRVELEVERQRPHRVDFHLEGHKAGSVELGTSKSGHFTATRRPSRRRPSHRKSSRHRPLIRVVCERDGPFSYNSPSQHIYSDREPPRC